MPAKSREPRGVKIPLPADHWWPGAARAAAELRAERLNIRKPGIESLVEALAAQGVETSRDTVEAHLSGKRVTWEVAIPLSKILTIDEPVVITSSPEDAKKLREDEDLRALRRALDRLKDADRQRDP